MSSGARSSACWRQATEKGRSMLALSDQSSSTRSQQGFAADAGLGAIERIANAANRSAAPRAASGPADEPSLSHTVDSWLSGQQAITVSAHFQASWRLNTVPSVQRTAQAAITRHSHGWLFLVPR